MIFNSITNHASTMLMVRSIQIIDTMLFYYYFFIILSISMEK